MRTQDIFRVRLKRFSRGFLCFRIPPSPLVVASTRHFVFLVTILTNPKSTSTCCRPRISSIAHPMQASFTLLPLWYVLCHPPLEPVSTSFSCVYKPAKCSSVSVVFLPCLLLPLIRCATLPLRVLCLFLFLCRTCSCTSTSIHHRTSFVSICAISLPPPSFHQFPLILYHLPRPYPLSVFAVSCLHLSKPCTLFLFLLFLFIPSFFPVTLRNHVA